MRSIEAGDPGLRPVDRPIPEPAAGEVLVRVIAAGVNRADLLQVAGRYPPPPGESDVLGLECSGTVAALGDGVHGWRVGDEVVALLAGGGYAEYVCVPQGQLLPLPNSVDPVDGAGLPEVVCTVYRNVLDLGGLASGETLLVHGGTSGIGTMAIQLGHLVGASVLVTCGSAEKCRRAVELGADAAIDYRTEDFVARTRELTDLRGADVVLDTVGAKYLQSNIDVLARSGRIAVIGMQGGARGELDLAALMAKNGTIRATGLRALPRPDKARVIEQVLAEVWPAVAAGRVQPVVSARVPLADAAEAHRLLMQGRNVGKVVLTVA